MIFCPKILRSLLLLLNIHALYAATIFSNSLQLCYDQCLDRNLALPLPAGSLVWPNITATNCDFDCLVDACRSGCKDLESLNSTCDVRCNSIGDGSAACHQGCRAVADLFLHQLQQLVELVSVEAFLDVGLGLGLNWSFADQQATVMQEISTTSIRWLALSRAVGTTMGWRWTPMENNAFREPNVQLHATVFVPMEQHNDLELQLVALWRDIPVVSRPFQQTVLLPLGTTTASTVPRRRLKPTADNGAQLQLASNGFVACWRTEERVPTDVHETAQFRLRLFSIADDGTGTLVRALHTNSTCHFFRNLPDQHQQFQLGIADVGTSETTVTAQIPTPITTTPIATTTPTVQSSTTGATTDVMVLNSNNKITFDEDELVLNITLQQVHDGAPGRPNADAMVTLLFSDGTGLYMLDKLDDFVMLSEPSKIAFALNSSQSITALACLSETELLVGLSDGAMFRLNIGEWLRHFIGSNNVNPSNDHHQQQFINNTISPQNVEHIVHVERIKAADGVPITQIVVSEITERIYAVRDKLGIMRCHFYTCENATVLTLTNSPNFIYRLAEDAWNGFLYYATTAGDVFTTPMLPLDASQNYSLSITRRLAELPAVNSLEVDLAEQKLITVSRTGQLISRDLINGTVRDERESWTLSDAYRNVVRAQFYRNRLFWTSSSCGDSHPWESCLFSEEFDHANKAVHLSKYLYPGPVKEFVLLKPFSAPPFMVPPSKVGLIMLTDSDALLSWRPPTSLPFQAIGSAWRALSYEYVLHFIPDRITTGDKNDTVQTSTTVSQGVIPTTHITVPVGAEPVEGLYNLTIRACTRNICSAPVITSTRPLHADRMYKSITLYVKKAPLLLSENAIGTTAGINGDPFLLLNMIGAELPADRLHLYPKLPPADVGIVSLAFDNSSGILYQSWQRVFTVTRSFDPITTVTPLSAHFLDSVHFHAMALLVSRATVLFASSYTVFAYRSTSSFYKIVYNCQPWSTVGGEECGKVYGIATEEDHPMRGPGRVFLLTMLSSGAVQLLSCSSDLAQPFQLIATTNHFPYKIRQMAFADDRLLILTDDGFFGTIDLTLQMINLNFAVRDIQFLLASDNVEDVGGEHRIHFEGPIQFDDKLGQFSWTVSSWQNPVGHHEVTEAVPTSSAPAGVPMPMLYKLSLYREAFGGERIVLLSQSGTYQLPQRLTQAWNSRQKFDLVLEAFNAWSAVALNRSALLTPTKPPSAPRNVRIYATQHRTVDGTRAIIDLFWDEPKEWNGDQLGYTVNCTIVATVPAGQQQGTSDVQSVNATLRRGTNRAYTFSVRSGKISCLIFAMNDQRLVGPPSSPAAEIDGSEFKPLIRLFAIDSTDNLVAIQNWTIESVVKPSGGSKARFLAKNRKRRQIAHTIQYQAMTYVGGELYAIRKEPEMSQLALVKLDINQVDTVIFKASLLGEFSQIDAMAADWVANRLLLVSKRELMTIHLDQLQDSPSTVLLKKLFQLSLGAQDAKQLVFDPFTNTAYLLTKNGSLFSLDLNKGIESNLELTTGCLRQKTITSIVGEFIWNKATSPQLYALTWNGLIELKLNSDNNCPDINVNWSLFGESGLKAISLFTVADKVLVFATPTDLLVYDRQAAAVSQFPSPSPPIRQLLAVSQSSQPFPDRYCFQLPPTNQINFNVKNEGRTGAVVEVHELQQKDAAQQQQQPNECVNVSQPITQYDVHFRKHGTDKHQQEKIKNAHSSSNRIVVDNGVLEKYTDYDVTVSWLNHYCPAQGQSEAKPLHTGFGYPSAPKDPKALALTPDTVLLSWTLPDLLSAPAAEIRYRISQQSPTVANPVPVAVRPAEGTGGHFSTALAEVVPCEANPCLAKVPNLRPSTDYHFWVVALHINRLNADDPEATSGESQAHTRDIPGTLRLENVTSDSMFLRWNTLMAGVDVSSSQLVQISIQYRQSGVDASWTDVRNSTFSLTDLPQRFVYVDQLHPATAYDYRYAAEYTTIFDGIGTMPTAGSGAVDGAQQQQQPTVPSGDAKESQQQQQRDGKKSMLAETFYQQSQQARTKAGTPSAPLEVKLNNEQCYSNDVTTKQPPQQQQQQTDWTTMTTPTTTTMKCEAGWTVRWSEPNFDGGEPIQNYAVEYRADTQTEWEIAERGLPPDRLFWRVAWAETHSRRGKTPSDEELVQGQFRVRAANAEGFGDFGYTPLSDKSASGNGPGGISFWLFILMILFSLMLFSCCIACGYLRWKVAERRRIREKLHKPICLESIGQQIQFPQSSHKFSQEVLNELKTLPRLKPESVKATKELGMGSFGRVCEGLMLTNNIPPTSVRVAIKYLKDNCEENRVKFLKEAILMKNFDHPNIVKLLGVSMEGEQFLVLELMDGGDMRNFLQKSRPHRTRPSRVSLRELIAMIVDVGRGCVYLEKYKHVHRDLAARNCLISSATSLQRVTKIADFGHARELFVDDYYRFRGGDLLPLRWLSPEVINQGLFTSKSDMWAFGVLLWEIVTLGEQPYSHMSNAQVLARLSSGMALDRPPDCPNELYDVMKQAWTVCTEKRPQFADIQPRLETMRGLPAFQSRDPFPPSSLCGDNSFFDASQNSSTSKGEQSSTTTTTNGDGEESYTTACQFDKSGESFSVRRNAKRSCRKMPSRSSVEASTGGGGTAGGGGGGGGPSASYSFGTTSTGVDSSEYEMPRSGAQLMMTLPGSRPTNHRRSATTGFHQNDAFVADSSVDESANGGTGGDQQRFTRSISLAGTSRAAADEPLTTPFRQFGASSSRISRV